MRLFSWSRGFRASGSSQAPGLARMASISASRATLRSRSKTPPEGGELLLEVLALGLEVGVLKHTGLSLWFEAVRANP
jgi:hypothetical protein